MNNSKIIQDEVSLTLEQSDNTELLREREANLVKVIESIEAVSQSSDWSTLKSVFDSRTESLEKQLRSESEQHTLNDSEMYRLQGRLFEARKYNLDKLNETYREELSNIRRTLTQPTER